MLTGPYFKPFIDFLNLSRYSFALPFRWDAKKRRLIVTKSKPTRYIMALGGGINVSYVFLLVYQLIGNFSRMTPAMSMIVIMWLSINFGVAYSKLYIFNREYQVRDFFNLIITFEEEYFAEKNGKNKGADPSVVLVLRLTYLSVACFPLAISSYLALQPCTPPFMTAYILQCNDSSELAGWMMQATRLSLAISEGMFWFHIVGLSAFFICFLQYLSQKCLRTYLIDLKNIESGSENSGSPLKRQRKEVLLRKQAAIFRQVQLLHTQLHFLLRQEIMPMAQTTWIIITVVSLYTTIKLHHVIGLPLFLFFPMVAVDGAVFFYVVIGATSQTYQESYNLIHHEWRMKTRTLLPPISLGKWFSRFRKSCIELRTYVGSIDFLDKTTPLAIIHFCLAQTGGLILLRN